MTWSLYKHVNVKGLYIDRKMLGILSLFVILGVCLVIFLIFATNTLSGLRAYSTMLGYWTEARVDAVNELNLYLKTGDEAHLDHFVDVTEFIRDARDLRYELISDSPDYDYAREKLLAIHTESRDVEKMITTFERFHTVNHFSNAVDMWENANRQVVKLEEIAEELRTGLQNGVLEESEAALYLDRVNTIDNQLRENRDLVTASLSGGTRMLQLLMIWTSVLMGGIILLSGGMLSYRFLKRIKVWARIVEVSEQRYKSLFENNPNAVFSLTKKGLITSGNDALLKLSGFDKEDLNMERIDKLVATGERSDVLDKMKMTVEGAPQSFETKWKQKNGPLIPVQATMLPIKVDDVFEGVFVIVEDISFQKYAEEKIKKQLDEKTVLLGEVHDRVKNNLALMLSMLQLQDEYIKDEVARQYLKSTITRIRSIALVHEHLYQTETFTSIRMDEIVQELVDSILTSYYDVAKDVDIDIDTVPVTFDIKKAIPCGLLLNELISNAFRFACDGQESGTIKVSFEKHSDTIQVTVSDNGPGLPEDFDIESQSTLGMTLVRVLVAQLEAEIEFENNNGLDVRVFIPDRQSAMRSA